MFTGIVTALGTVRGARLALGAEGMLHVAWNGSSKASPKGPGGSAPMLYTPEPMNSDPPIAATERMTSAARPNFVLSPMDH